jgi:hypothetical protein
LSEQQQDRLGLIVQRSGMKGIEAVGLARQIRVRALRYKRCNSVNVAVVGGNVQREPVVLRIVDIVSHRQNSDVRASASRSRRHKSGPESPGWERELHDGNIVEQQRG